MAFDPESPIGSGEKLARFILNSGEIREDCTLKPDLFIPRPPPYLDLSVTRHDELNEAEIWERGQDVASERQKTLLGRADALASVYTNQSLNFAPEPRSSNLQHLNVIGWPNEKPAQKNKAQRIAAGSKLETLHSIRADAAASHIGDYVTVEGIVSQTHKTRRGILLLNFGGNHPNQLITAWIEKPDELANPPLPELSGRKVKIVGKIQEFRGRLEIAIRVKDQLIFE
jgi:hypothetical protein